MENQFTVNEKGGPYIEIRTIASRSSKIISQ